MTKTTMIFPEFSLRFVDFAVFLSREAVQVMLDSRHLTIIRNRYTRTGSVPIYVKNVHVRMYVAILIKITRRVNAQGSVTIVYKDGGRGAKACSFSSEINQLNCLIKSIKCDQNSSLQMLSL